MNGFFILYCCCVLLNSMKAADVVSDDVLAFPYSRSSSHRQKRDDDEICRLYHYGNRTSVKVSAHSGNLGSGKKSAKITLPLVEMHRSYQTVGNYWMERNVLIQVGYVNNPVDTVSVYEPLHDGTCNKDSLKNATVLKSAERRQCLLAVNAGFFNITSQECLGNIVSNGRLVQDSEGLQNAHFGITRDGNLFFGYLSEIDIVAEDFLQLVGGVIWVLKDGEDYVDRSILGECEDTQTTGSLQRFASVISARTLVGHDDKGRLMVVQINGKTDKEGASLYEAAAIMKDLGAINAVNLDGGGSSTIVYNHSVINYPSDLCNDNETFLCERNVTTILCVHDPICDPPDCGGHGSCDLGVCHCDGNWKGANCNKLKCRKNCSDRGTCTEDGCICQPGYYGDVCATSCHDGWYGNQCSKQCYCNNNATCDKVDGRCLCAPGFTGDLCQNRCKFGYYGDGCSSQCVCDDSCSCDHETGSCNYTYTDEDYVQAGTCIANKLHKQQRLESDMTSEYQSAIVIVIILAVISSISLTVNLVILWKFCSKWLHKENKVKYKRAHLSNSGRTFLFQNNSSFTTSTSSDELETSFIKKSKQSNS